MQKPTDFPAIVNNVVLLQMGTLTTPSPPPVTVQASDGRSFPIPTLQPALSPTVELSLTIVYISLYSLLFLLVYVQLWMIFYYKHKRLSYQVCFLFLCLVWSALRTTLFSFYFADCDLANDLPGVFYWLLYCFPVCLQFITLCLLFMFFAQVVFKARAKYEPSKYKTPVRILVAVAVLLFLASNVTCAIVIKEHERKNHSIPSTLVYVRVAINDSLFILVAGLLSVCIFKMAKMSSSNLVLEAKGTTMCQAVTAAILITMLYTSRAVYNFISISQHNAKVPGFGYDWVNVSDQADMDNLSRGYAYVSFGIVLFVWEILPTFIVIMFFRVKRSVSSAALSDISSHSHSSRVFFFDNPRRYDSEDDLSREQSASINNTVSSHSSQGTPPPRGILRNTPPLRTIPRSTPPARGIPRMGYGSFSGVSSSYTAGSRRAEIPHQVMVHRES